MTLEQLADQIKTCPTRSKRNRRGHLRYYKKVICPVCLQTRWTRADYKKVVRLCRVCCKPPIMRGKDNPSWKGGRTTDSGYILVWLEPTDPYYCMVERYNYVREHRLVVARALGRPLLPTELVHHLDGDKTNNVLANLQIVGRRGHSHQYREGYELGYKKGYEDGLKNPR